MGAIGFPELVIFIAVVAGAIFLIRRLSKGESPVAQRAEGSAPPPVQARPIAPVSSPSLAPRTGAAARVFLGYRREDSADVTGRIYDKLATHLGRTQVFKDVDSVPFGIDFRRHLEKVVGSCEVVFVVIGDRWLTTTDAKGARRLDDPADFVRIEVETALTRDIPVVPVLVRGAQMPKESELPDAIKALAYRNGINVRSDPDFHNDMDRLIAGLGLRRTVD